MAAAKSEFYASKLRTFHITNKRMPSYSEMQDIFGLRSKNAVFKRVLALVRSGVVDKDQTGRLIPKDLNLPIRVLGTVAAGFPSPAEEELSDTMSLDAYLIASPQSTYILKVDGDSMIDAGIHPGDLVLVQKGLVPRSGDIVVARVDNEWTLKYFEKSPGKVILRAANKKYPPITPKQELTIAGVVVANVRKYK
ncbi:MAG: transcriptional repressor LexA [Candidatus Omnitrophica bacterium]|nr:transcriptional repressor LexA [Candidatus Omnitrophota bacterium]